jgi:hypothetical protein
MPVSKLINQNKMIDLYYEDEDDKSSTSGSEINDEYVLETSCNLNVNRNEKQVSQNLFFSRK